MAAFCHADVSVVRWLGAAVLLAVVIGYRPRWFALPHAWIAWTLSTSMSLPEGGDQIASNLAMFLCPVALLDGRKWVWRERVPFGRAERPITMWRTVGLAGLLLAVLQGFVMYFDAAISKILVPEWADGTATYYWMRDLTFSPGGFRGDLVRWVTGSRFGVTLVTWGTLVLEFALAAALVASLRYRRAIFFVGLWFHITIAATYGLVTFMFSAAAQLTLYLHYDKQGDAAELFDSLRTLTRRWIATARHLRESNLERSGELGQPDRPNASIP